jgi:isopentenyl-diphosphate delta-isomerase type 2
VRLPVFISCMTGGSEGGISANRELAAAAQAKGVPVGMGSIRILFEHPELFSHFHLKALAPDVPVLANIGAAQVRDVPHERLLELCRRLQVDALVVHLNPGQELFQPEGDRDFRGLLSAIGRLCGASDLPIVVKETGFGIRPARVRQLLAMGASCVDLAGAGGTNWITVEAYRLPEKERAAAAELSDWGLPTALILAALGGDTPRVLASGGVRTGLDVAKSLALGAEAAGLALPLARRVVAGGAKAVVAYLDELEQVLRAVMVLTGSRNLAELRRGRLWFSPEFAAAVKALREAEAGGAPG